jgi:transposase
MTSSTLHQRKLLRAKGKSPVLTKTRWILLKRKRNLTGKQGVRLRDLLACNLRTVKAYLLEEQFQHEAEKRSCSPRR